MTNIERAMTISGWMAPDELRWLAIQATQHKCIAEIGSWMGRSTRALADNTAGTVYAVDAWTAIDQTPEGHKAYAEIIGGKDADWLFNQFKTNMAGVPNYQAFRTLSLEGAECCKTLGYRFDMIFIDAGHDYESCKADILAWRPLLAPGGLLCGHDYNNCPGVNQAVDELIAAPKIGARTIWYA